MVIHKIVYIRGSYVLKLPNGFGSVHKLSGNRRKPWRARITDGWEYNETKDKMVQVYKTVGYYTTRQEALTALAEYNKLPYDLDTNGITFSEMYEKWTSEYFDKLAGSSSERTIKSAYAYCSGLYNMKVREIRTYHMKDCIDKGYVIISVGKDKGKKRYASANTKARIKSLLNLMFDYAMEHDIVTKNYARLFSLDDEIVKQKKKDKKEKIPFTDEEIKTLWENVNSVPFTDMLLIGIYSGWRPQELATMSVSNIDWDRNTMFGGMKTTAGQNRYVPIHPLISELVKKRYEEAKVLNSDYLFNNLDGQQGTTMTYDKYRRRFEKVISKLRLDNHTPHETRHTFITKAKKYGVDEYVLKLIVGHAIDDVTEKIYTHREIEELQKEIDKIKR